MPVVEEVSPHHGLGGEAGGPFSGDELVAVEGEPTSTMDYEGVIHKIRTAPRPLTLVFR